MLSKADDLIAKATVYASTVPQIGQLSTNVASIKDLSKKCKALVCECLLAFAQNNCQSAEWQAKLVRTQLTEIMLRNIEEKDVHPILLKSARAVVDQVSSKALQNAGGRKARQSQDGGQDNDGDGAAQGSQRSEGSFKKRLRQF